MRCPKCGKDVELQNKQVGVDENGEPIFNEYAICRDCKKQWNLNKQKVKKAPADDASDHIQPKAATAKPAMADAKKKAAKPVKEGVRTRYTVSATEDSPVRNTETGKRNAPVRKAAPANGDAPIRKAVPTNGDSPIRKAVPDKEAVAMKDAADRRKPIQKKRTATAQAEPAEDIQKYGNIPSEKVRTKRERAVRQNYEEMLAADSERKPTPKKKPAPIQDIQSARKSSTPNKNAVQKKPEPQPQNELPEIDDPEPKFKLLRIIFGIISLVAFAFFAYKGFMTGLSSISSGKNATAGTIYIVLALCMLVAGLLLLIMQKKSTIFAFVLPMLCYFGSAVFAFLKRGDEKWLLYGAAAGAVLGIIFLILTFASGREDKYDDYDDPFEDDSFDDDFED